MKDALEVTVSWGAVVIGALVCTFVGWLLIQEVRRGTRSRFSATVVCGLAVPFTSAVPILVALGAKWLGSLAGLALFSGNGGNSGNLVGVGITGMIVAFSAAALFAALMLFQALTGSGSASVGRRR